MNLRKWLYFTLNRLRGEREGTYYERYVREDQDGILPDTTRKLLVQLLEHCQRSVPYYREIIARLGNSFHEDPEEYLKNIPILTKEIIQKHFDELKSNDLKLRRSYYNTSGGSTGEPVRFIQDWEFADRSGAITLLISKLLGREIGECEVYLWGSERDIIKGHEKWQARLVNKLTNSIFINAFRMTQDTMRSAIALLNAKKPKLIVAYAEAIYELARFAEREKLGIIPQKAIITSAGTLYPFMREKIEKVFQCKVYNRYGSREVSIIACERPGCEGLWVAPWGNYIEVVDSQGNRVPDGTSGEILVTSLTNFAMPLIRYKIGDLGELSDEKITTNNGYGQVLKNVLGRTVDAFITNNGCLIDGEYFTHLLYFKDWIRKFQVIQKSYSLIVFRIVLSDTNFEKCELGVIAEKAKLVIGNDCEIDFEFVDEIPASGSGKFRYTICEIQK
jgi:phenylacetate-CoA ligase